MAGRPPTCTHQNEGFPERQLQTLRPAGVGRFVHEQRHQRPVSRGVLLSEGLLLPPGRATVPNWPQGPGTAKPQSAYAGPPFQLPPERAGHCSGCHQCSALSPARPRPPRTPAVGFCRDASRHLPWGHSWQVLAHRFSTGQIWRPLSQGKAQAPPTNMHVSGGYDP